MIQVVYKKEDKRFIFLKGEPGEMEQLESHLNKIPSYMFMPSFTGIPRPEVFLNKSVTQSGQVIYYCHSGLWRHIYEWCNKKQIRITGIDDEFKYTSFPLSLKEFTDYVLNWNLKFEPRDYQIKSAWLILKYRQSLSELATRAGKTLIAYIVFRYMLENGAQNILMIVPSIQLVKQGVSDMSEYQEFFKSETVWANSDLCDSSNLTIGTFQSLILMLDKKSKRYNPDFFNKFDIVCVDEAHHLPCKSINTILNQKFLKNVKLKFGFTGTLPKENTIESFACQSIMGPKIQEIRAEELINEGFLAKPNITQIRINYNKSEELIEQYIKCGEYLNSSYKLVDGKKVALPKEQKEFTIQHVKVLPITLTKVKPTLEKDEYVKYLIDLCKSNGSNLLNLEHMLVHRSQKRIQIIKGLLDQMNGNCIIFAHNDTYITYLSKLLKEEYKDKIVRSIKGTDNLKKRQKIIDEMLKANNVILVASYGCCGTGLTFKNVDYGIFAQSFKSDIINKQSLGRLMLKNEDKEEFILYDLVDVFPSGQIKKHGDERLKIYKKEGYDVKIKNI